MNFTFSGPNGISPADGEICLIKTEERRVQGLKKKSPGEGGLVEPPPFIPDCADNSGTGANAFCVEPTF